MRPWHLLGAGAGMPVAASGALLLVGLGVPNLVVWAPPWVDGVGDPGEPVQWIGHRGGVVEEGRPEGSLAALRGAVERGYAGVEVDVRETRDGVPVVHHDASLARGHAAACEARGLTVCRERDTACVERARDRGLRRCAVGEMTAEELRVLTAGPGTVVALEVFLNRVSKAGMDVMLDFKQALSARAMDRVEASLRRHMVGRRVYLIGVNRSKRALARGGGGRFGAPMALIPMASAFVGVAPQELFLFQNAFSLGRREVVYGSRVGIEVIPSLNWHHMGGPEGVSHQEGIARAHQELRRLYDAGVRTFQIDSDFDGAFVPGAPRRARAWLGTREGRRFRDIDGSW